MVLRYVLKLLFGEKKHKIANNLTTNAAKITQVLDGSMGP
jgi:hypothetical protein